MTTQPFLDNNDITHFASSAGMSSGASAVSTGTFGNLQSTDTLVVMVMWDGLGTARSFVSLTDTEGYIPSGSLAAYLRSSFVASPGHLTCQVYAFPVTRPSATVNSESVTFTISGSADKIGVAAAIFAGVFNSSAPWDSNAGLLNGGAGNWASQNAPAGNFNGPAYSTSQANDLALFLFVGSQANGPNQGAGSINSPPHVPTGTPSVGVSNSGGTNWGELGFWFIPLTSTQSGAVVNFATSGNGTPTWYAVDALTSNNNSPGETGVGAMAFAGFSFAASATVIGDETSTGALAFTGFSFTGATDSEDAHAALAFTGFTYRATTKPPFQAAMHFAGPSFGGFSGKEVLTGGLAYGPFAMAGAALVPPLAGGGLSFLGFAFDAGGGGRVAELDVAAVAAPAIVAQVSELDVAAVGSPGAILAVVTELDVAVVAVPAVTTLALVSELDVASLVYIEPCATARCYLWKITRRDGAVYAFTSLDSDFVWMGVTYKTCKSLTASASDDSSELKSAGGVELTGILDDASISDEDLYSGLFDDATVEVWRVPYDGQPDDGAPLRITAGNLGKVTRGEYNFTADVMGPGARLSQTSIVDFYIPGCRWDFGVLDANGIGCPVNAVALRIVNLPVTGSVLRSLVEFTGVDPGEAAIWNGGKVIWQTGRNAGIECQVETVDFGAQALSLWDLAPYPPAPGDLFTLEPGCPKTQSGCDVYGVFALGYGGFMNIPGPDALQSNADSLFT